MKAFLRVSFSFSVLLIISCSCCLYFNHYYNTQKYYRKGLYLRQERTDSLSLDSLWCAPKERKAFEKVLEKGSRILERWPQEVEYKPEILFLMGESYWYMGKWDKSIAKYDEFEKYFPEDPNQILAQYHRAYSLVQLKQYPAARFALREILANPDHPYRTPSLQLIAQIETNSLDTDKAIEALEELLLQPGGSANIKAKAHYQLAEIYFSLKNWKKAHQHYLSPLLELLLASQQYTAQTQAAECLYQQQKYTDGITLLQTLIDNKQWQKKKKKLRLLLARYQRAAGNVLIAENIYLDLAIENNHTPLSAEAWYWIGDLREELKKYTKAIQAFKSVSLQQPYSSWGKKALPRQKELENFLKLQKRRGKTTFSESNEFQLAELFLFRLSEVDSALYLLDSLSKKATDERILQKSLYAQAFILESYKKDTLAAHTFYKQIINRFPNTTFAQQAQKNLGLPSNILTAKDQANRAFTAAESSYLALESLEDLPPEQYDSLEAIALAQFDTVSQKYSGLDAAAQAHYFKAWVFETKYFQGDSAKNHFEILSNQYSNTPWGKKAQTRLQDKTTLTRKKLDKEWDQFRKEQTAQKEIDKKRELEKAKQEPEEELLWDFEEMYDVKKP